jgi:hypothetical protein
MKQEIDEEMNREIMRDWLWFIHDIIDEKNKRISERRRE